MAEQKGGGGTAYDSAQGFIIIACVFFAIFLLFWHFEEFAVKNAWRWFRLSEMSLVAPFVGKNYGVMWEGSLYNYRQTMEDFRDIPSADLDGDKMRLLSYIAMYPLHLPFVIVLGALGLWTALWGPGTEFRRKLDLNGLIRVQSKTFPIISPFVDFNPADMPTRPPGSPVPLNLPPFAEALAPEEWVAWNQIPAPDNVLNEQSTYVAFARQLGPRWTGSQKLPPYRQVLLAAFCLKASRKRKEGDAMLGRLSRCWSAEKGLVLSVDKKLLGEARKVLRDKKLAELTLSRCAQHGFETTAMLRALATAREEGGVLAPAQFVWLRAYDRALWYPLNSLGRQAHHMEALGAMAHYKAEKMTRRPIPRPKVQDAVRSISELMRSPRARPIPPVDKSKPKAPHTAAPRSRRPARRKRKTRNPERRLKDDDEND